MRPLRSLLACLSLLAATQAQAADSLYACGNDQVREYRLESGTAHEIWRWRARDAVELPAAYRHRLLANIDQCKPVDGGRRLLLTASTGGVVLLDRHSGKVEFRAEAPMAHAADVLPHGLIAVALSLSPQGNRLQLYDRRHSERPLFEVPLYSGHGAIWDARRHRLFALSFNLLQTFTLDVEQGTPVLRESAHWRLPGRRDGHVLAAQGDGRYWVSTDDGVWLFDPDEGRFTPYAPLAQAERVKSISVLGERLAWVQAEQKWWAHGFHIGRVEGGAAHYIPVEDLKLYKVDWNR